MKPTITHEMLQIATASHERLMEVIRIHRRDPVPGGLFLTSVPKRKKKYVK